MIRVKANYTLFAPQQTSHKDQEQKEEEKSMDHKSFGR